MSNHYSNHEEMRGKILKGVNTLADNVSSTLGPKGRNVIIHKKDMRPFITKDGVTVAKSVDLDDPFENLGAQILKEVAIKTNSVSGDGTTTATVLARAILLNAQVYLAAGASPVEIKKGIDKTVAAIVEKIEEASKPVRNKEDITHVATISSNNDKDIGELIALAVDQSGKNGAITVEEARSLETSLELIEGFQVHSGYVSPAFVTEQQRAIMRYEDAYVLVTDHSISSVDEIFPVLQIVSRESKPFIIVSENIEGQALAALVMNTVRGTMKVAAVKAPGYGETRRDSLSDLALSVGATFVTRESGIKLKEVTLEHLGHVDTVEATKNWTTFVGGIGEYSKIEERVQKLKAEIMQTEVMAECEVIQERISRLSSSVAIIRVGGATDIEVIEKKHRIEDALSAVKSAQEQGIVPGGGVSLIRASEELVVDVGNDEQQMGVDIVLKSVQEPLRQMAVNAGKSADIIVDTVKNSAPTEGYNFAEDQVVDMMADGIIDPAKVTISALQNAASVSSTLMTANYAIVQGD